MSKEENKQPSLPIGKTAENDSQLRKSFSEETGVDVFNSQGEFDIDYIHWLEQRILDVPSSQLQPSQVEIKNKLEDIIAGCLIGSVTSTIAVERIIQLFSSPIVSDEELLKHYESRWHEKPTGTVTNFGFVAGAKWMRDKWLASHKGEGKKK